jgi:hypothetical protein
LIPGTCDDGVQNQDEEGVDCGGVCEPCSTAISGCIDVNATNYNATATIQAYDQYGNLSCVYASCDDIPEPGCIYPDGFGPFNSEFGSEDCLSYGGTPCIPYVGGCTDITAFNYDPLANTDDGSCIAVIEGCTDETALNYNEDANTDDGSCIATVEGCMDMLACNYDSLANTDDGSCFILTIELTDYGFEQPILATTNTETPTYTWFLEGTPFFNPLSSYTPVVNGTFSVTVTDNSGCTATASTVVANVSLEEQDLINVSVYPIPATNVLNITSGKKIMQMATLYDIDGKLICQQEVNSTSYLLNRNNIPAGYYMLDIEIDNQTHHYPVVFH